MSTMRVTNLKHENSASNNIVLNSDGSVGGDLGSTLASKADYPSSGNDGDMLTKSGTSTSWTTPSSGKIAQIVTATYGTQTTRAGSTSWADTGLTATITPTSASNDVLVIVHQTGLYKAGADILTFVRLLRDATELCQFDRGIGGTGSNATNYVAGSGTVYMDSPATTSATTYKTQYAANVSAGSIGVCMANSVATICLMEIIP